MITVISITWMTHHLRYDKTHPIIFCIFHVFSVLDYLQFLNENINCKQQTEGSWERERFHVTGFKRLVKPIVSEEKIEVFPRVTKFVVTRGREIGVTIEKSLPVYLVCTC